MDNRNTLDAKESAIQKGIGDQEFWASESKRRTTKGGGLPSDWATRREVVHAFDNLVTLCRDCHALMPQHEGMKADIHYQSIGSRVYYYVSSTGTIHQEYCQDAHNAKRVSDLYTRLLERGFKPYKKYNPAKIHEVGVQLWTPRIAKFVEESIGIYRGEDSVDSYLLDYR